MKEEGLRECDPEDYAPQCITQVQLYLRYKEDKEGGKTVLAPFEQHKVFWPKESEILFKKWSPLNKKKVALLMDKAQTGR